MHLEPLEIYILDCFRESARSSLSIHEILADCTATRRELLKTLLVRLEKEQGVITRDEERVVLTASGREFLGLAAPDSGDRLEHRL